MSRVLYRFFFFFFNDTATTEIYTLSLHDALPISDSWTRLQNWRRWAMAYISGTLPASTSFPMRSEEHTSELQSHLNLVCRLLLEKKKKKWKQTYTEGRRSIYWRHR